MEAVLTASLSSGMVAVALGKPDSMFTLVADGPLADPGSQPSRSNVRFRRRSPLIRGKIKSGEIAPALKYPLDVAASLRWFLFSSESHLDSQLIHTYSLQCLTTIPVSCQAFNLPAQH